MTLSTPFYTTETVNGLPLYRSSPQYSEAKGRVLILGNAFRVMPYQSKLAEMLAMRGWEGCWFPYHGQPGTDGTYTGQSAVSDLVSMVDHCRCTAPKSRLAIIAHCASCLVVSEFLGSGGGADIDKVVFYGFLAQPLRRREDAERIFPTTGGHFAVSEVAWGFDPRVRLGAIDADILFCHARDEMNAKRASDKEVQMLAGYCRRAKIRFFDEGYDRRTERLEAFAPVYADWIELA